jgi:hypothetical protein
MQREALVALYNEPWTLLAWWRVTLDPVTKWWRRRNWWPWRKSTAGLTAPMQSVTLSTEMSAILTKSDLIS